MYNFTLVSITVRLFQAVTPFYGCKNDLKEWRDSNVSWLYLKMVQCEKRRGPNGETNIGSGHYLLPWFPMILSTS